MVLPLLLTCIDNPGAGDPHQLSRCRAQQRLVVATARIDDALIEYASIDQRGDGVVEAEGRQP